MTDDRRMFAGSSRLYHDVFLVFTVLLHNVLITTPAFTIDLRHVFTKQAELRSKLCQFCVHLFLMDPAKHPNERMLREMDPRRMAARCMSELVEFDRRAPGSLADTVCHCLMGTRLGACGLAPTDLSGLTAGTTNVADAEFGDVLVQCLATKAKARDMSGDAWENMDYVYTQLYRAQGWGEGPRAQQLGGGRVSALLVQALQHQAVQRGDRDILRCILVRQGGLYVDHFEGGGSLMFCACFLPNFPLVPKHTCTHVHIHTCPHP